LKVIYLQNTTSLKGQKVPRSSELATRSCIPGGVIFMQQVLPGSHSI